jgi:hypothetical protein
MMLLVLSFTIASRAVSSPTIAMPMPNAPPGAGSTLNWPTNLPCFELAYLPFSHGGPSFWPRLNYRIGLQNTHWNKFDGATTNTHGMGRNAGGNDMFFAYIGTMF